MAQEGEGSARSTASSSSARAPMAAEGGRRDLRGGGIWRWEWIATGSVSLSPGLPARDGGQAGAQVRGRAGVRGGHLLLPTGGGGRRQDGDGPGQVRRHVTSFPFLSVLFLF